MLVLPAGPQPDLQAAMTLLAFWCENWCSFFHEGWALPWSCGDDTQQAHALMSQESWSTAAEPRSPKSVGAGVASGCAVTVKRTAAWS